MTIITTPEQLFEEVCACFGRTPKEINVPSKVDKILRIRQYYAYVGYVYYKFSLASLGKVLIVQKSKKNKVKDHSCIIHSRNKVKGFLDVLDTVVVNDIEILKTHLDLNAKEKADYEQLEQQYNDLVRDYAQLKQTNKRLQREKNELENKNITLRQEIKTLSPKGIFGQPIKIEPLLPKNQS